MDFRHRPFVDPYQHVIESAGTNAVFLFDGNVITVLESHLLSGRHIAMKMPQLDLDRPLIENERLPFHQLVPCGYRELDERVGAVSYTHLRAHETGRNLVC